MKYSKSHKIAMLIITINSPRVKIISGAEISFKIGLRKKFIKPRSNPAINKVKISPSKIMPGTR